MNHWTPVQQFRGSMEELFLAAMSSGPLPVQDEQYCFCIIYFACWPTSVGSTAHVMPEMKFNMTK